MKDFIKPYIIGRLINSVQHIANIYQLLILIFHKNQLSFGEFIKTIIGRLINSVKHMANIYQLLILIFHKTKYYSKTLYDLTIFLKEFVKTDYSLTLNIINLVQYMANIYQLLILIFHKTKYLETCIN